MGSMRARRAHSRRTAALPRGTQREIFTRYPSWDELKSAKYKLLPVDVPMSLEFPVRNPKEGYLNVAQTCLHLWEKLL